MIEVRDLSKIYMTGEQKVVALEHISLSIQDGEIYGIIGLSGAGKSTLLRCLNRLETPTSGQVLIDGQDLSTLSVREQRTLRQSMSMIFQGFHLFEQRSVLRNIQFPLEIAGVKRSSARDRAEELLALVGLPDRADAYPSQLSGGQKQRVAIARALATSPRYLLCDEATSALDVRTTREILSLLRSIHERMGVTIVVITHELSVIEQLCERVSVLSGGHLVEEGTVREVLSRPRSDMARSLIFPDAQALSQAERHRRVHLTIDDPDVSATLPARMALETDMVVPILSADTGEASHILIHLPPEESAQQRVLTWLDGQAHVIWARES